MKKHNLQERWKTYISMALLLCIVFYTIYIILSKVSLFLLDSDMVNEITYRYTCWKEKTLFPTNFICSNESFASRPVLLYGILYAITQDFMGAFLLENCVTFVLLAALVFFTLKLFISNVNLCILGVCWFILLLPVRLQQVFFLPMNAYVLFSIVILLTIGIRVRLLRNISEISTIKEILPFKWYIFFLCFLAAISGLVTIKLLMVLYVPFFVYDALKIVHGFVQGKQIPLFRVVLLGISVVLIVFNLTFQIIFLQFRGDTIVAVQLNVASIDTWFKWDVISAQLQVLLHNFGIDNSANLASAEGLRMLIGMGVLLCNAIILGWYYSESKNGSDDLCMDVFGYWLSATGIILTFQIISAITIPTDRYYFASALVWPILTIVALDRWCARQTHYSKMIAIGGVVLLILSVFLLNIYVGGKKYREENAPTIKHVAQYIEEHGYGYVTGTYWNSDVITGYTNGAVQAQHSWDLKDLTPFYWLTETTKLEDPRQEEPNILLLTDEEEIQAISYNGALSKILQYEAKKIHEISEYNLYLLNENPFTLAKKISDSSIVERDRVNVRFYNAGICVYDNGYFDTEGNFVTDGTSGFATWGPYTSVPEGTYRFTLNYEVLSSPNQELQVGEFDVAVDAQRIACVPILAGEHSVTLEVEFVAPAPTSKLEYRTNAAEGAELKLKSIEINKVEAGVDK